MLSRVRCAMNEVKAGLDPSSTKIRMQHLHPVSRSGGSTKLCTSISRESDLIMNLRMMVAVHQMLNSGTVWEVSQR